MPSVIRCDRGGTAGDQRGLAAWKEKWEHMYDGLENVSVTIEQNVASGGFSANRYSLRGTHAASGRSYEVTGLDMIRVRDGKLVEHWALLDSAAMTHQLGEGAEPEGYGQRAAATSAPWPRTPWLVWSAR